MGRAFAVLACTGLLRVCTRVKAARMARGLKQEALVHRPVCARRDFTGLQDNALLVISVLSSRSTDQQIVWRALPTRYLEQAAHLPKIASVMLGFQARMGSTASAAMQERTKSTWDHLPAWRAPGPNFLHT